MVTGTLTGAMKKMSGIDFYGHPVGVHYQGSGTYSTKLGGLCSIITIILIAINTFNIVASFFIKTD